MQTMCRGLHNRAMHDNASPAADREFVHSRLIDASREQVYAAFVAPANEQNLDRLAAEVLRASSTA
jgi:hypothetical protein